MNNISMKLNADPLILSALQEDITSEDITTNSVMPHYQLGEVELICKENGVIAGLDVFKRVFTLLNESTEVTFTCKDGDRVRKGERLGGTVVDVFVWHKVYGRMHAPLNIYSRAQVKQFIDGVRTGKSTELMAVTGGYHYHTIPG